MDLDQKLRVLQRAIVKEMGFKVDLYYYEGYGALAVRKDYPLHIKNVVFAFPDDAIKMG